MPRAKIDKMAQKGVCRYCTYWQKDDYSDVDWGFCHNESIVEMVVGEVLTTNYAFGCIGFEKREFVKM